MPYQVTDWDTHFEKARSREVKAMTWVPVPNKFDGDGYTELVDHENGAAHLGAWLAILQIASKCEPRGVLLREGNRPHDARSLARLSRLRSEVFDEVLPRLVQIGWLSGENETSCNGTTESCASIPRVENKIEKEKIGKEDGPPAEKRRRPSILPDEEYLDLLQSKEAYRNLNVRAVNSKMLAWCELKGKQGTRMRLVNWLNREDQPIGNGNGQTTNGAAQTGSGSNYGRPSRTDIIRSRDYSVFAEPETGPDPH